MTREEHKRLYRQHQQRAEELHFAKAFVFADRLETIGRTKQIMLEKKYREMVREELENTTAASAHLALAMILNEVDAG